MNKEQTQKTNAISPVGSNEDGGKSTEDDNRITAESDGDYLDIEDVKLKIKTGLTINEHEKSLFDNTRKLPHNLRPQIFSKCGAVVRVPTEKKLETPGKKRGRGRPKKVSPVEESNVAREDSDKLNMRVLFITTRGIDVNTAVCLNKRQQDQ